MVSLSSACKGCHLIGCQGLAFEGGSGELEEEVLGLGAAGTEDDSTAVGGNLSARPDTSPDPLHWLQIKGTSEILEGDLKGTQFCWKKGPLGDHFCNSRKPFHRAGHFA